MQQFEKDISKHFRNDMPKEIKILASMANHDLYFGPISSCDECESDSLSDCSCDFKYPGFTKACNIISNYVEDEIRDVFYQDGFITTREPEGEYLLDGEPCDEGTEGAEYCEPFDYYHVDKKQILEILFGRELASYVY